MFDKILQTTEYFSKFFCRSFNLIIIDKITTLKTRNIISIFGNI